MESTRPQGVFLALRMTLQEAEDPIRVSRETEGGWTFPLLAAFPGPK